MPEDSKVRVVIEGDSSSLAGEAGRGKQSVADLGAGTEKAAEQTKLFSGEGREMHRVISELNRVSPLLGEALRVAMHPVGGTIAAAIALFVGLKSEIDSTNKKLDELGAAAAAPDFLAGIESKVEILRNAAVAAEAYANKLADIKRGETGVADELKKQLELDKAIEQARAGLVSAEKGLAIAKIQADEAAHKISPEKAAEERAAVEKKFITQQQADREAAEDQELRRKTESLDQANAQQAELRKKQKAAADAEAEDAAHRAGLKSDYGDNKAFSEKQAGLVKQLDEAQKDMDRLTGTWLFKLFGRGQSGSSADVEFREKDLAVTQAQNALAQLQAGRTQFFNSQSDAQAQQDRKDAAADATKELNENTKALHDLPDEIKRLTDYISATRPINRQTADVKGQTVGEQERGRVSKSVEEDVRTLSQFERSKEITPEMVAGAIRAGKDIEAALLTYHGQVVETMSSMGFTIQQMQRDMHLLQQQLAGQSNHTFAH